MTLDEMLAEEAQLTEAIAKIDHLKMTVGSQSQYGWGRLYRAKLHLEKQRAAIGDRMHGYFVDEVTA